MSVTPTGTGVPTQIGPYRIEREIARGGMGIVYLARDTQLDRAVAIKALPDDVAADPERLARFEREAKTLASLHHPNIAGIYGVEMAGGRRYLVLEHIEGETLAARISRGKLPLAEAVELCAQIAAGVEAAHESGVIHRDLKPGNVMITPGDQAKVLDFGLAKGKVADTPSGVLPSSPTTTDSPTLSSPTLPHSPTIVSPATMPGVILGTAAYLSPEQARGKPVDRRTDIWSFGCVLYECLTGKRVFEGETVSDTIAKILERDVDWRPLPVTTPSRLRELLHRCLEKDARKRLRDIGEARLALESVLPETRAARPEAVAGPMKVLSRGRDAMRNNGFLFAAGLILGALLGVRMFGSPARDQGSAFRGVLRARIPIPSDVRPLQLLLSSDGRYDVLHARPLVRTGADLSNSRIYVRRTDRSTFEPISGTEGAQGFTLSPDGRWLAFVKTISERSQELRLYKAPLDGSAPAVPVVNWDSSWDPPAVWLASGEFVALAGGGNLVRIAADGSSVSKPRSLKMPKGISPTRLGVGAPFSGDRALFLEITSYDAGAYHQGIGILDLRTAAVTPLLLDGANPRVTATGHLLYTRGDVLYAAPFDAGGFRLRGPAVPVLSGLRTNASWGDARFEITRQGTLVTSPGASPWTNRRAIVVDPGGTVTEWSPDRQAFENSVAAAPDGRRFASLVVNSNKLYEVWISERGRPSSQRVIALPGTDVAGPMWTRDGSKLSYGQQSNSEANGIYVVDGDGGGTPRWIVRSPRDVWIVPVSWSPDGTQLLCMGLLPRLQLLIASPAASGGPVDARPLFSGASQHGGGAFSPDGRWIAYFSDESGRNEVYVSAWAGDRPVGAPLMVSEGGGLWPTWHPGGRRLFYLSPQRNVMSVDLTATPGLDPSRPRVAWSMDSLRIVENLCDILPDGRLLAVQRGPGEDDVPGAEITINFLDEMKRKIAAAKK